MASQTSPALRIALVGMSGATATMRSRIGPIRANSQARLFLEDLIREAVAVGRGQGVPLAQDYTERRMALVQGLSGEFTTSMQVDLSRGNRLEVPWIAGAVVEMGRQLGVAVPLNRAVSDVLALYANGSAGKH